MGISFSIVLVVAVLLGVAIGATLRRLKLASIKRGTLQKPQYSIDDDLSPAEFGFIIDGKVGIKELVGEVVKLAIDGHLDLTRDKTGRVVIARRYDTTRPLHSLQAVILKTLGTTGVIPITARATIEYETMKSLKDKNWIAAYRPFSYTSAMSLGQALKCAAIGAVTVAAATGVSLLLGVRGTDLFIIIALSVFAELVAAVVASMFIIIKGEALNSLGGLRGATTKYRQDWQNVKGVYDYIQISGMDVFTPDYSTLDFKGLDKLYPYAVAAGLDKELLRIFDT